MCKLVIEFEGFKLWSHYQCSKELTETMIMINENGEKVETPKNIWCWV
jgi:hypothetical protein